MVQKIVEVVPQVQFLIEWWMCQLVMVRVSQCSNTAIQTQYIGKIACVVGNEIEREVSTTHNGMLASKFEWTGLNHKFNHQEFIKTEIDKIFV